MHFLPVALSRWLGQIAMPTSEHGICAASSARTKHLKEGHPGRDNWERMSQEMMMRGRHDQGWWITWIEWAYVSLRKRKERTKNQQKKENKRTKDKEKQNSKKQTKAKQRKANTKAETSQGRAENRTRLKSAWTLLREFFQGLPRGLLRESEG
jgi:hypothetical protein